MKRKLTLIGMLAVFLLLSAMGSWLDPAYGQASNFGGTANPPFTKPALTTTTNVKTSAGNVYGYYIYNPNASACSLDFFNVASASVTLGTTVPVLSLVIPATAGANLYTAQSPLLPFSALSVAAVTAAAGGSTCGTGMTVNLWYQ